jgi:hypothetical protein
MCRLFICFFALVTEKAPQRYVYQVLSTSKLSRSANVGLHVMKNILNIMVELRESALAVMIT